MAQVKSHRYKRLLKRGYPIRVAEKIVGANFARTFNDIWTTY
jgi:microsomal dipeptidase-like Zn-dependent dipeptidase